jgi:tape measure domain-containing protein
VSVVANVAINVDARGAAQELNKVDQAAKGLSGSFGGLQAAVAALGVGLVAKSIADVGTQSEASKIKIKALTAQYGELGQATTAVDRIQKVLGTSAIETRDSYAQLYGSLRGTGLGAEQLEVLFVGLNKAARLSGGGAQEAQAGIMQLKQAFSSGALSGDELRSVLENMPVFAQAVAKETDRLGLTSNATSADLKRLGAEGKLTSTILFDAAKKLATMPAPELTSIEKVNVAFSNLAEKIAEAVGPTVVSLMTKFSAALSVIGRWFAANQGSVQTVVSSFGLLVKYVGPLAVGILAVVKAYQAWQIISKALAATQAFLMALTGPQGIAMVVAAGLAAGTAYVALNNTLKETDEELKKQTAEAAKAKAEFAATVAAAAPLPSEIEDAEEKTKQLKEAQDAVTKAIESSSAAIDKTVAAQTTAIDQVLSVTNARIEAEKAINNVLLEQAQRQLDGALNQEERVKAAGRILDLTIEQAKLERDAAYASIEAEQKKIEIAIAGAKLKEQEVRLAVELAKIQGTVLQAHYDTLSAATELVNMAVKQRDAASEVAKYQRQAADASFDGAKSAANAAYQSNITVKTSAAVATNTTIAAESAGKFAANLERGAQAAVNASKTVGFMPATGGAFTAYAGAGGIQNEAVRNQMMQLFDEIGARSARLNMGGSNVYAKDIEGFSQTVQNIIQQENTPSIPNPSRERLDAMMAENAERLRMQTAQTATATSSPSNISPQVSIQTGPVTQMNGTNYVTAQDMSRAVQSGVQQTINMMRNDRGTRQAVGLA